MDEQHTEDIFQQRLDKHIDEIKWLYMELYDNEPMLAELTGQLKTWYEKRDEKLKTSDRVRERALSWHRGNEMLGITLNVKDFAGDLQGVKSRIDYLLESQVNWIHLMPFLDSPLGKKDGEYAVTDFRKVRTDLGTIEDLKDLTNACHEKGIHVCMDFVMNHTSDEHEWAVKARGGNGEYMSRYFFFDNYDIPAQYEKTIQPVFSDAPGSFTWCEKIRHYVMTTIYPYQWDLNYKNPRVFNEMMYNFLFLANCGIDCLRLDGVSMIWKEIGTSCRNLPKVHTILRLMRMIGEIVCPGVLLLGDVGVEPKKSVAYFGVPDKPECHMLYNQSAMAAIWHTVATRDARLLKMQMDIVNDLPKQCVFLNYLRNHDDVIWKLDYDTLKGEGFEEESHRKYLNEYFLGHAGYSDSRGRASLSTDGASLCATTASMCGLEQAIVEKNEDKITSAIQMDLTLHAFLMLLSGIPVICSGDEIGQINDYSYEEDPARAIDPRNVQRGAFNWEKADLRNDPQSPQGRLFAGLSQMERIRSSETAFMGDATVWTIDTGEKELLAIGRYYKKEKVIGFFNFSERYSSARYSEDGDFTDLITGETVDLVNPEIAPHGFLWLKKTF